MSEDNKKLIKKYFQFRQDVREDGFWIDEIKKNSITKTIAHIEKPSLKTKEKLKEISEEVKNCRKCPLGKYRLNPCFGNGSQTADLLFIGEGPGYSEDHNGEVFIGRAGMLLTKIIESTLKLNRCDVYITNIVKCHPMKDPRNPQKRGNDRAPTKKESERCMELYLIRQIAVINPKLIVTLGLPATKTILNSSEGISQLRGKRFDVKFGNKTVIVIPTYHPAYLLRDPSKKRPVFNDMKFIKDLLLKL